MHDKSLWISLWIVCMKGLGSDVQNAGGCIFQGEGYAGEKALPDCTSIAGPGVEREYAARFRWGAG